MVALVAPAPGAGGYTVASKAVNRASTLSSTAKLLYPEILSFAQHSKKSGACSASVRTIGATIGKKERVTRDAIKELVQAGLFRAVVREASTTLLYPVEVTTETLLRLKPYELTTTCWKALLAAHPTDEWVQARCPERARDTSDTGPFAGVTPSEGPARGAAESCRPYMYGSYDHTHKKASPSCSFPARSAEDHQPRTKTSMDRKPRAKPDMRGAVNSPGYRAERERRASRPDNRSTARKIQDAKLPPVPTDPTDLTDVEHWKTYDFVRLVRALTRAKGVSCTFTEIRPDGKWALSTAGSNKLMNEILDLVEASGVQGKHRQALFLINWISHWDKFCEVQPSASRVGFVPRYWLAAWKNILPWLRTLVAFDTAYAQAAVAETEQVRNAIIDKLERLYTNWPDDRPEINAAAARLMSNWPFTEAREFKDVVRQNRLDPKYAELWSVVQGLQKA